MKILYLCLLLVSCSHKISLNDEGAVLNYLNNLIIEEKLDFPLLKNNQGVYEGLFAYENFKMIIVAQKEGINQIEKYLKKPVDKNKCHILQKDSKYPLLVYLEGRNIDKLGEILKDGGLFVYNINGE